MFINRIFERKLPIRVLVDSNCKYLIADFEYIKETPEGTKFKQVVRDEKMGASYEKYSHASDDFDYFICSAFESYMD